MLRFIARYFRKENNPTKNLIDENSNAETSCRSYEEDELAGMMLSSSLSKNKELINRIAGTNSDLVVRDLSLGVTGIKSASIYYFDSMIDTHHIDDNIIRPLTTEVYSVGLKTGEEIIHQLNAGNVITRAEMKIGKNANDILKGLLAGEVGLFIDTFEAVIMISARGYKYRSVPHVEVEPSVMGPLEAFIEVISVNIGLIRRRIQSPNLNVELMVLGSQTNTKVGILYIKGICKTEMVDEVRSRLKAIDVDGINGSTQINEFITDNPYSLFPQFRITERPDVATSALLEGRVVIMTDGTPDTLIVPCELASLLHSAEDYNTFYIYASAIRILRYIAIALATALPALYISVTSYHHELLPENLIESIAASRIGVPFPAVFEALIMEFTFELLREAGVRLARPVGQAVSIVGALVIGQAAVQANVVSPLMVIVVALTGIASFVIPQYIISFPIRLLRFALMVLAAVLGFFGLILGLIFILFHLCSLRSFGVPYLSPASPFDAKSMKDTIIRFPYPLQTHRPGQFAANSRRMKDNKMPRPPDNRKN